MKPKLKAPVTERLKLTVMYCFQLLLSNLTCTVHLGGNQLTSVPDALGSLTALTVGRCRLTLFNPH